MATGEGDQSWRCWLEATPGGLQTESAGLLLVLDQLSAGFAQPRPANLQGWLFSALWGASPQPHSCPASCKKEQVETRAMFCTALGHRVMANTIDGRAWWRKMGHDRCGRWPLRGRAAAGTVGGPWPCLCVGFTYCLRCECKWSCAVRAPKGSRR